MIHNSRRPVSVLWQLPQWFVLSVSEVLVSVTGLEYAYTQVIPTPTMLGTTPTTLGTPPPC